MPRLSRLLATAAAAPLLLLPALLASPAPQDEGATSEEPRPRSYTLRNGRSIRGTILESEEDRVRLKLLVDGGTAVQWYGFKDFEPRSQVRLKHEQVPEGDVVGQLAVAEFAAALGQYDQSRTELKRCAYMLDASNEAPPASFKDRALALTIQLLEAFCARGDVAEARSAVSRLVTKRDTSLTEQEKLLLVETVEAASALRKREQEAERRGEEDAKAAAERARKLAPIQKHLSKGKEKRRKGLLGSRKYSAASRDLESALEHFQDALEEIETLREGLAGDDTLRVELDAAAADASGYWQDTLLSHASLDLARGKFNDAMESVNTILADHPGHAEALAMRGRIEVAQSDWGW